MKTTKEQQGLIRKMVVDLNNKDPGPAWLIMLELLDDLDSLESRVEMLENVINNISAHIDGCPQNASEYIRKTIDDARALSSPNQVEEGE